MDLLHTVSAWHPMKEDEAVLQVRHELIETVVYQLEFVVAANLVL